LGRLKVAANLTIGRFAASKRDYRHDRCRPERRHWRALAKEAPLGLPFDDTLAKQTFSKALTEK
jgi:hypothetical protein